jgi:hypothetical protein
LLLSRTFLENILPFSQRGLVVVFTNTCNQAFTYQVNGYEAEWLGPGDLHDSQFDFLNQSLTFEEIGTYSSLVGNYGGLPIDQEHCAYTVTTYPSQTMKDKHHTNNPIIFTVIACCIFLFTAVVFIGYDMLVSMRYVLSSLLFLCCHYNIILTFYVLLHVRVLIFI